MAQRLVAAGERVVDVSTRRAALVRLFAGGNGRKNDDVDAHSVALVGLHSRDLPEVRKDDRSASLRLLANRRKELVDLRTDRPLVEPVEQSIQLEVGQPTRVGKPTREKGDSVAH